MAHWVEEIQNDRKDVTEIAYRPFRPKEMGTPKQVERSQHDRVMERTTNWVLSDQSVETSTGYSGLETAKAVAANRSVHLSGPGSNFAHNAGRWVAFRWWGGTAAHIVSDANNRCTWAQ